MLNIGYILDIDIGDLVKAFKKNLNKLINIIT